MFKLKNHKNINTNIYNSFKSFNYKKPLNPLNKKYSSKYTNKLLFNDIIKQIDKINKTEV